MPRGKRTISSTGIYHVIIRGINQQRIFEQAEDYEQFLYFLYAVKKQSGFTLFSYCLMGNHAHLLLKEGAEPLAQIFRRLGTRYAQWFNIKYERSGHLFQNRFGSAPVEDDEYFLNVLLYIYQNPVKAGIYRSAEKYEWCSRRVLGEGDGLVDETELGGIIPIASIKQREHDLIEDSMINKTSIGRRVAFADKEVAEIIMLICGAQSASDFHRLSRVDQKSVVTEIRGHGVPIRQIARLTGMSKGMVEYWCKK